MLLLILFMPCSLFAQEEKDTIKDCEIKTVFDLFKKKDSLLVVKPVKNSFFLVMPVIGSQPATGFMYGGVAQYTFKGKAETDKYSVVNLGITYTTKKQLLINLKNSMYLKNNRLYLNGDCRLYIFSQSNYGLGTGNVPPNHRDSDFDIDSIAQPMEYDYFKFHQTASWEVSDHFYVGGGINLDWYSSIDDELLNVDAQQYTYHYNYSKKYGFNNLEYFLNGVSANVVYDSRDNQVNASEGWFGNINYRVNPAIFNDQEHSSVLYSEFRKFIPLGNKKKHYILGLWAYGQFVMSGKVPYLNLPALGWDPRSRSGEGYTQGLFRGFNLIYTSAELRFPLMCNQLLGATVFTNFITTSDKDSDVRLFQYVQPAVGVGLRIMIDKASRTNLVVDYAFGRHSKGFYLNAGETF